MRDFDLNFGDLVNRVPQTPDQRGLLRGAGPLLHADCYLGGMLAFFRRGTRRLIGAHRRRHSRDLGLLVGDPFDLAHDLGGPFQRRTHRQSEVEVEFSLVDLGNQLGAQLGYELVPADQQGG